jgi:hypothetical protein
MLADVTPRQLRLSSEKVQKFSVEYNCKQLLKKPDNPYFDSVKVLISTTAEQLGSSGDVVFEFKVVCDSGKLGGFDLNFLALFGIAVGIIVLAIKTPPLLIFNDMTEEER